MLDDAMHSNGDSGRIEDIKLWGMWNILGKEVFGNDREEEIRSWYYTWSLMCRHFPAGSKIMRLEGELPENVDAVAAILPDGSYSIAAVNYSDKDQIIRLELPTGTSGYMLSCYDAGGFRSHKIIGTTYELSAQSFAIFAKE